MDAVIGKVEKIFGEVNISGSKNAALPIIIGSLLIKGKTKIFNVPDIIDINNTIRIIKKLNVDIEFNNNTLIINNNNKIKKNLLFEEIELLRGSSYFWGVLLKDKRKLKSFIPGGCKIGNRPFDLHYDMFNKLGIKNQIEKNIIYFKKTKRKEIKEIIFSKESLGTTINLILYTVISKYNLKVINPSLEPEVLDLINFLNKAGANIKIIDKKIYLKGVKKLKETEYKVMFDRIEAGSYMLLASCFKNSILKINNINIKYLENILNVIHLLGIKIDISNDSVTIKREEKLNKLDIVINTYPSFPTDLQQILTVVLLNSGGKIKDLIFPNRTSHIEKLKQLNADINVIDNEIIINKSNLLNNEISGIDLRGTFGLIVACGMIKGNTKIINVDYVFRGYEKLEEKLQRINFPIQIVK